MYCEMNAWKFGILYGGIMFWCSKDGLNDECSGKPGVQNSAGCGKLCGMLRGNENSGIPEID